MKKQNYQYNALHWSACSWPAIWRFKDNIFVSSTDLRSNKLVILYLRFSYPRPRYATSVEMINDYSADWLIAWLTESVYFTHRNTQCKSKHFFALPWSDSRLSKGRPQTTGSRTHTPRQNVFLQGLGAATLRLERLELPFLFFLRLYHCGIELMMTSDQRGENI